MRCARFLHAPEGQDSRLFQMRNSPSVAANCATRCACGTGWCGGSPCAPWVQHRIMYLMSFSSSSCLNPFGGQNQIAVLCQRLRPGLRRLQLRQQLMAKRRGAPPPVSPEEIADLRKRIGRTPVGLLSRTQPHATALASLASRAAHCILSAVGSCCKRFNGQAIRSPVEVCNRPARTLVLQTE